MDNITNLRTQIFLENLSSKFIEVLNEDYFPTLKNKNVVVTSLPVLQQSIINNTCQYIVLANKENLTEDWLQNVLDVVHAKNIDTENFTFIYFCGFHDKEYIINSYKWWAMGHGANVYDSAHITKNDSFDKLPLTVLWKVRK